jgi:hypothetical protein
VYCQVVELHFSVQNLTDFKTKNKIFFTADP